MSATNAGIDIVLTYILVHWYDGPCSVLGTEEKSYMT